MNINKHDIKDTLSEFAKERNSKQEGTVILPLDKYEELTYIKRQYAILADKVEKAIDTLSIVIDGKDFDLNSYLGNVVYKAYEKLIR